ncbi:MFS transporter [Aquisalimonas asiatica]|uniref:Predicted arabinose efflux permease, MFS family n=1 Tax=Aquisalimonas asiatica TaxID=406100 RepID=A0A1H8PNL6_9GAMM|nr:MFS transporter [Aquisalimonas asiatica]SEO43274.1 Predicted arabinose efflux permease, MFS family [Aquisalimonas asiatica]
MAEPVRRALLAVIVAGVCLDTLIYGLVVPMLPQLGAELDFGQTGAGILLGSYAFGLCVATPLIGLGIRHWGYRLPLIGGIAGLAAVTLLFVAADSFTAMITARMLQGATSGATWTAGLAVIANHWPSHERGRAMGMVMTGFAVGLMAGPPLGGIVSDLFGITAAFLAPAAVALLLTGVAASVLLRLPESDQASSAGPLARILTDPGILGLAGVVAAVAAIMGLLEPTLPLFLERQFGSGAGTIGVLFGLIAVAFGLGSPLAGYGGDRWGAVATIRRGAAPLVLLLPLFALAPGAWWTAPLFAATGLCCALALGPALPGLAARIDQHDGQSYGIVYALFNLAFAVGLLLGPVVGALLAEAIGLLPTLLFTAAAIAAFLPALRRLAWIDGEQIRG